MWVDYDGVRFPVTEQAVILLAEDREDDIFLIRRAFQKGGVTNPLFVVRDGEEAVAYLEGRGKYFHRDEFPLPALLLLDLKMPKMDGFEVLKWLRQQSTFSSLRVVVLTSSNDIRDANVAYQLGANSFLVKPMDFENVVELSKVIQDYWLRRNKAPELSREPKKPEQQPKADS
jgi:CheY-like chemotaxis protein